MKGFCFICLKWASHVAASCPRRPRWALACGLLLAGCATTGQQGRVVDTFCASARKIPWSIHDDRETIRRAEIHNRTIDRRCGIPGQNKADA
jgi:hypothetical protein